MQGVTKSLNPSIALKFLRSGVTSANQFGMVSFDNIPDGRFNFWHKEQTFKTHLPSFKNDEEKFE